MLGSWKVQRRKDNHPRNLDRGHKYNLMTLKESPLTIGSKVPYKSEVSSKIKLRRPKVCKHHKDLSKVLMIMMDHRKSAMITQLTSKIRKLLNRSHVFRCRHIILKTGMRVSMKPNWNKEMEKRKNEDLEIEQWGALKVNGITIDWYRRKHVFKIKILMKTQKYFCCFSY